MSAETGVNERIHAVARIEDAYTAFRARISRFKGKVPTVAVFRGYGGKDFVRVLARVLYVDKDPKTKKMRRLVRGWRAFVAVPVAGCEVTVRIGEQRFTLTSDRGGVIDETIKLNLPPGRHTVMMRAGKGRGWAQNEITVSDPKSNFGIVCDVDDTVMVTALPRILLAAWNTFVLDEHARRPVPGMAVLLNKFGAQYPNAMTFYLSTGPWNIAPTLERFLSRHMYPRGPFLLTDWGATPERAFRSGREHKRESLKRLALEFPDTKWVLVGDDGQHDEKIYGEFARQNPGRVLAVVIRQLSTPEAVLAGSNPVHPEPAAGTTWVYGHNGAEIAEKLFKAKILGGNLRH